jgi:hypothetical protein
MRGEQVAFDTLGNEAQPASLSALCCWRRRRPAIHIGNSAEIGRNQFDGNAGLGQRFQPGGFLLASSRAPGRVTSSSASGEGRAQ